MVITHFLLFITCILVFSYEEIAKKKWFASLFFFIAFGASHLIISNQQWQSIMLLLLMFATSRFIFYSLSFTKKWPINLFMSSAFFYLCIWLMKIPLERNVWFLKMDVFFFIFLIFSIVISTLGLFIYFKFRDFDVSLIPIPPIKKKHVSTAVILGSIINSLREEIPFRWLLMLPLAQLTDSITAVLIQASIFGAMHFHEGFTNKRLGYLMTMIFGIGMGFVTIHSQSLLPAIIIHAVVDMILLAIVMKRYVPDSYFKN